MKKYNIKTNSHEEIIDITDIVSEFVSKEDVKDGMVIIHIPHTTAGITVNENADPDVKTDIIKGLKIFDRDDYRHMEGNSAAHIKSSCMGCNLTVTVEKGELQLGTWQGIMFCEFDGPRTREVWIKKV